VNAKSVRSILCGRRALDYWCRWVPLGGDRETVRLTGALWDARLLVVKRQTGEFLFVPQGEVHPPYVWHEHVARQRERRRRNA
jgi:hypothetical protein